MCSEMNAQVLDFKMNYGINNYFEKQILYKNIYKAKEELFKKLRVKRVSVAGRNIEYFINRDGLTDTIVTKIVFQNNGQNNGQNKEQSNHRSIEAYTYDADKNLIQINTGGAELKNIFSDIPAPQRINFFYTDKFLTKASEEYNGSGSDKDMFVTYNEEGLLSKIISVGGSKKDTSLTNFIYDENKRLVFIGRDTSSGYGYKFMYKGDTIVKITNNSWGEESVIEGNRPVKIISYPGINLKENTAYSTEEYFYRENGLSDKIVYTDKDGSKTEVNFDYEFYKD
ncbi:MAG: hypothetical protein J0M18_08565 [Ignavibacteria bacterium]|nr:hypothetical protein [Ignavibacteria bacterium]